jgi:hypothetical protein
MKSIPISEMTPERLRVELQSAIGMNLLLKDRNGTQTKLLKDTIRLLIDALQTPVSEQNHIDKLEIAEAGEIVLAGLEKVK